MKHFLDIVVENKKGTLRNGHYLTYDYGYLKNTVSNDGEELDVYLGHSYNSNRVFVVRQNKAPEFKEFDEYKCFVYFDTEEQAKDAYLAQYDDPRFFGGIFSIPLDKFIEWAKLIRNYHTMQTVEKSVRIQSHEDSLSQGYNMSSRTEAIKLLKSLQVEIPEEPQPVEKALTAKVIAPSARQYRMHQFAADVAYDTPTVGTTRARPDWEPPVVPVRRVEPEAVSTQPMEHFVSCGGCGTVHKSIRTCPRCDYAAQTTEVKGNYPLRGR